jgi:hypothetical protein
MINLVGMVPQPLTCGFTNLESVNRLYKWTVMSELLLVSWISSVFFSKVLFSSMGSL